GCREAAALLLTERHRLQWALRRTEALLERPDSDQAGERAQRAVVAAARPLRVDVRAGDDRRAALRAVEPAPDAPNRVAPHAKPGLLAPRRVLVGRRGPLRRVDCAPDAGLAIGAEARQAHDVALDQR